MPDALIVDDHKATASALGALAEKAGFTVAVANDLDAARQHVASHPTDIILLDLRLPDGDGLSLLDDLSPDGAPAVVLITGEASVQSAVTALRRGITDYLTKPVDTARLKSILDQVAQSSGLGRELRQMSLAANSSKRFGAIVGGSKPMQDLFGLISRIAPSSASVLIAGESGTGKEVVAKTIHEMSRRRKGPFVAVNCGAITPTLMESELFGHERGAFTGAERRHRGIFERADGGTLFLDEITEMPLELQVKFLRVLETGVVRRLGGEDDVSVDVRLLAATNRSLDEAIQQNRLREDLLYRVKVFQLQLPPLRDRVDDIEPLAEHFLAQFAEREGGTKPLSSRALTALTGHTWPGNVRELRNVLYSAYVLADETITPEVLPLEVRSGVPQTEDGDVVQVRVGTPLAEAERRLILATLASLDGNKTRSAEVLGISLKTLYARLADYKAATQQADKSQPRMPSQ